MRFQLFTRVITPHGVGTIYAWASHPDRYGVVLDGRSKDGRWETSTGFQLTHSTKMYPQRVLNFTAE